ncbi:hypothetical protein [Undibacterium rugosum]|uniref:hypothetical protein n=1 Tax=Undibacterium rugosum TaxID=2762291 RepID=UPI001B82CB7F|nr:hypothetical protein [Undibacterium rugosum]MBR7777377.1 hypothetical protein [Undibacterium rugosum]
MEKLLALFARIPTDKQGHALGGAFVFAVASLLLSPFVPAAFIPLNALLTAAAAGTLKEIYDAFHPDIHTCDFWDFFATTAGGFIGFVAVLPYQ